jgi:hypothetical protein
LEQRRLFQLVHTLMSSKPWSCYPHIFFTNLYIKLGCPIRWIKAAVRTTLSAVLYSWSHLIPPFHSFNSKPVIAMQLVAWCHTGAIKNHSVVV